MGIRIFRRFGQVLIANMLFALMFALLWIPALLEWRELIQCFRTSSSKSRGAREACAEATYSSSSRSRGLQGLRGAVETAQSSSESYHPPEGFLALGGSTPR